MKKYSSLISLFLFICLSVLFKLMMIGQELKDKILLTNTLDFSWQTDSIERLLHGFIAGRDFIFTYGPLFQFLASMPSLLFDQPSYVSVLLYPIFLTILICLGVFFIITCLTKNKKTQIIALAYLLFIIDINAFDSNTLFRIILPFVYILLYDRFASVRKKFSPWSFLILSLPALFGLYTFDLVIICALGTLFVVLYELFIVILTDRREWKDLPQQSDVSEMLLKKILRLRLRFAQNDKYFFAGLMQFGFIGLFVLLTSFFLTGNLTYLLYSLDTVKNYQSVMNIPITINHSALLFLFPITLVLLSRTLLRNPKFDSITKRTVMILALMALLQLKSGFIRADEGHIVMGIYPSLLIVFLLLFFLLQKKVSGALLTTFFVLYLLIPYKNNYYEAISVSNLTAAMATITANNSFFDIYRFPDNYPYSQKDFVYFTNLATDHPGKVMIYPYDTYLLNISHHTYNSLALQFYQYAGTMVEQETVKQLKQFPPQFIILGIDTKGAVMLDDIPNFSRNPIIAKWMLMNYTVHKKTKMYLVLRFDPEKKLRKAAQACDIYSLSTRDILTSTLFERISKPSLYYFTKPFAFRIPYTGENDALFIVEKYDDANHVANLFEERRDFEKPSDTKEITVEIIKRYPIPKFTQTITEKIEANCY